MRSFRLLLLISLPVIGGGESFPAPGEMNRHSSMIADPSGADTSWSITLVSPDEPGDPLVVSGTVFRHDGTTPAAGVRMYLYHTDARGNYSEGNRGGNREPRIRGWLTTDQKGRYRVRTIKPGSYPGSHNPAHIHSKVMLPGGKEQWIEEFLFEDDPYISEKDRKKYAGRGEFSPVMKVIRGDTGILQCTRNIILDE